MPDSSLWQKLKGLKEVRAEKVTAMKAILEKGETEKRDLTADEDKAFGELRAAVDKMDPEINRLEHVRALETAGEERNTPRPGRDTITDLRQSDPDKPINEQRTIDGFNVADLKKYSFMKALRQQLDKKLDGVEKEVSDELAKRSGKTANGFFFPTDIPVGFNFREAERRSLNTTTGTGGIATILDVSNFIDFLRNAVVVQKMGARMLTGLQGNLAIPKMTGAGQVYWVADESAPTASNQTLGTVTLSPNTVGAYTDVSRKFLLQSSISAEAFVRDDLSKIMAIGIDTAALNGSGSGNQPTGILQNGSVGVVALGTNGAAPTWASIVDLETNVAAANVVLDGTAGYVTNAKVRGTLKTTLKNNVAGALYMWNDVDKAAPVNGYPVGVTNSIPSNLTKGTGTNLSAMIYGVWSDLILGFWGMLDILVDPYTNSNTGSVRIRALQDVDIKTRHNESFQIITDMITQ